MSRFKINIEYDGTNLVGWQKQKNGLSVQEILENSLLKLTNEKNIIQGAGRTDAGVHALNQIAHFDLKKKIKTDAIRDGLNFHIKNIYKKVKISVLKCQKVNINFNARFNAKERTYVYRILDRRPPPSIQNKRVWHIKKKIDNIEMQKAAKLLVGKHDFSSFRSIECQAKSPIKTINSIKIIRKFSEIEIKTTRTVVVTQVEAQGKTEVTIIIIIIIPGTLVEVGKKKKNKNDILNILNEKKRGSAGQTAPPWGLFLHSIKY